MKNSIMISALGVVAVAALVTFSNSTAQDVAEKNDNTQQKVVWLSGRGSGGLIDDDFKGGLPELLKAGWRIVSITPSGGSGKDVSAYAILEK